ncbi:hypothetical protein TFLX_03277 [Thermoflexales bacterium]|nr:hypothetical protein TFLX_03277 [Thermoflexales bacterium]
METTIDDEVLDMLADILIFLMEERDDEDSETQTNGVLRPGE